VFTIDAEQLAESDFEGTKGDAERSGGGGCKHLLSPASCG